ncbi:MAG: universal stress protein [Desulfobacterales bacterium]|nr:MAG: universal stress protein [Desulfobacterales bacterium]
MIPKIKKILYATDLSPNSAYAFRYAMNSAIRHDANMVILHVFEMITAAARSQLQLYLDEDHRKKIMHEKVEDTKNLIKKRLSEFCEIELKDDPTSADRITSIVVSEGFPAEEILTKADELECDAIVMGTHSKGILANTFLGSTAKRVLRRTRKPVFIIPLPKGRIDAALEDI